MSDISKLIEALRASQAGGGEAQAAAANPILPLDQPVVFDTEKKAYVRAPEVPKVVSGETKPAASAAAAPKPPEQPKPPERK